MTNGSYRQPIPELAEVGSDSVYVGLRDLGCLLFEESARVDTPCPRFNHPDIKLCSAVKYPYLYTCQINHT